MAKKDNTNNYTKKSIKDISGIIANAYKTLGNARFAAAGSRSNNTPEGKEAQKTIARAKTELRSREIKDQEKEK